jgi:hypothetical protein
VVLHLGHHDLVTRAQTQPVGPLRISTVQRARGGRVGEGVGQQVQALRAVLGEDDLLRRGAKEGRDGRPRALERLGGLLGQLVRAAVYRS